MESTTEARGRYHHGNLRQALIEAALDLIAEKDVGAVSLRAVARRVGVTNAAPYHHFKDKTALLAGVAAEGFRGLGEYMAREVPLGHDVSAQLDAMGLAYIRDAIAHPAHYQIMFRADLHAAAAEDSDGDACFRELDGAATDTFGALLRTIARLRAELRPGAQLPETYDQLQTDSELMTHAVLAWSTVHGFATLWLQGAMTKKTRTGDWEPLARSVVEQVGIRIRAALAGD